MKLYYSQPLTYCDSGVGVRTLTQSGSMFRTTVRLTDSSNDFSCRFHPCRFEHVKTSKKERNHIKIQRSLAKGEDTKYSKISIRTVK